MSELKSRPPSKANKQDLDAFLSGAEKRVNPTAVQQPKAVYPWEADGVREDVIKTYNIRFPEPYLLKLKYIAEHTPDSMQKFCLDVLLEAIDAKIDELAK
jgi:hypothetical protein